FLQMTARAVSRWTGVPHGAALAATVLVLLSLLGLAVWQAHQAITPQLDQLAATLPQVVSQLRDWISQFSWGRQALGWFQGGGAAAGEQQVVSSATRATGNLLAFFVGL